MVEEATFTLAITALLVILLVLLCIVGTAALEYVQDAFARVLIGALASVAFVAFAGWILLVYVVS